MHKRNQELLAKQLRFVSNPPRDQNSATVSLIPVPAFLVGIGIGDILSKSKQVNTTAMVPE